MTGLLICILLALPAALLAEQDEFDKLNAAEAAAEYMREFPATEEDLDQQCVVPNELNSTIGPLNAIIDRRLLWPGGVVYYQFAYPFKREELWTMRNVMLEVQRVTNCIRFIESSTARDRLYITRCGNACNCYVGKIGGAQRLCAATWCIKNRGSFMHELLHGLGFHHHHQRTDRDRYISINYGNLKPQYRQWYKIINRMQLLNGYDYGSIMHYGAYSPWAYNTRVPVIIPKQRGVRIGQRKAMTRGDIERVQLLYGCRRFRDSENYRHLAHLDPAY